MSSFGKRQPDAGGALFCAAGGRMSREPKVPNALRAGLPKVLPKVLPTVSRAVLPACGYSLVELMVAMTIGLLVASAAIGLYRGQRAAFEQAADMTQMDDAGRAALDLIAVHARAAGFAAGIFVAGSDPVTPGIPVLPCPAGRPAGDPANSHCVPDARGSDGIQFSYMADRVSSWPSTDGTPTDCLGQAVPAGAVSVTRFFVKPSGSSGEPELYCEGSGRLGTAQPVVEGVETLRLSYQLEGVAGLVGDFATDATNVAERLQVVSICVLVRGRPTAKNYAYLDCDGRASQGSDRRRRQTYRLRLAARNLFDRA
jgi:type IV pilus assembly protein PilW